MSQLTPKQQRFVEEYLIDLNATQAAIRAGYSTKTAKSIGSANLHKADIAEAIEQAISERSRRTEITQDRVLQELAKLAFSNIQDYTRINDEGDGYIDLSKLTRDQAAAITEMVSEDYLEGRGENKRQVRRCKIKLADKRAPLVDIGKHLGMFTDRIEHTGNLTIQSLMDKIDGKTRSL